MKKVLFYAICLLTLAGCKEEPKAPVVQTVVVEGNDSLQSIIDQRDKELNDMLSVFNEIQEGFREINEAEKRVTLAKGGEGTDRATRIKNDMLFIKNTMKKNKDLINKLQNQLSESDSRGEELKRTMQATIDALVSQMEAKDLQLNELRGVISEKEVKITQMDEAITTLNNDVADLKNEATQKQQTINEQDKQLHMAYYVYGTKSELKEQNILDKKGNVLKNNFNKNYFIKIDYRYQKDIQLHSKSVKLLTPHPMAAYRIDEAPDKKKSLHITDPDLFWSTSKYLVIQVK
ncbi:MAG: hypothetical protein II674_08760 [Prevotella sp.]|nr:hypothetical protein [Prevotella sp.]